MKTIILKIDGMSCSACSNGLEKYLNKQKGIKSASVNLVLSTASINYEDNLEIIQIEKYIEEAGFKSLGEENIIKKAEKTNSIPFIIYGCIGLMLMYISMSHMVGLPIIPYLHMMKNPVNYAFVLLILTIPFLVYGKDLIINGIKNLIHKMPNMDTLVTIGILSSFLYSIFGVLMIFIGHKEYVENLYFESTVFVIYFIKLGRFIDKKSKSKTQEAIRSLVTITPEKAKIKTEDSYKEITIDEVKKGDILICLPGDKIAVDGEITKGKSHFDESFITGESIPAEKCEKSKVIAGSINYEGAIEYKAEKIGKDSTISEIVHLVLEATNTKAPISKIADRICAYFVPLVIIIATITLVINLILGVDFSLSLTRFITVLVIACPCSLGLATPLALVVSVGTTAKKGILIKDSESLEEASKVNTIVFDKTGTLTYGTLSISEINNHSDMEDKEILELLASIEKYSTHPLAIGINKYVKQENIKNDLDLIREDLAGYGVKAKDDKNIYYACNSSLLKKLEIINSYEAEVKKLAQEGNSVIYLVKNNKVIATFGLKDVVRKESKKVVKMLEKEHLEVIMLSGDNEITAKKIASELGITTIIAGVTPKEKAKYINEQIKNGKKVMMIGDGINDAPSLTAATIGVSLKGATDIATSSANIILMNSNLMKILDLINISKKTLKNIKENLFWAFIYNICMIPLATGIFKITINPMIACLAMILSSITVTLNALRLKK